MDLLHFGEFLIINLGKSKSGFEFLMFYNLKMLCESLKQKIVVFMLPLSW